MTEGESAILAALWRRGPLTAPDLIEEVRARQPWGTATVKTLLGRLIRKGAILSRREGGRQRYVAALTRDAYVKAEVGKLVERLFEGDPNGLREHLSRPGPEGDESSGDTKRS
ncbi:MAG TPA: crosslink repair DNA glycosylase YcaQ family protein [Caulobacteraceae bacterium]